MPDYSNFDPSKSPRLGDFRFVLNSRSAQYYPFFWRDGGMVKTGHFLFFVRKRDENPKFQDLILSSSFHTRALAPTMAAEPAFNLEGRILTLLR